VQVRLISEYGAYAEDETLLAAGGLALLPRRMSAALAPVLAELRAEGALAGVSPIQTVLCVSLCVCGGGGGPRGKGGGEGLAGVQVGSAGGMHLNITSRKTASKTKNAVQKNQETQ